tara:strand:+ start:977 stop:1291 length:315 start_codon:yes stop_codon:yes gene_type:complete
LKINSNNIHILLGVMNFIKNITYGIGGGIGFKLGTEIIKDNKLDQIIHEVSSARKLLDSNLTIETIKTIDKIDSGEINIIEHVSGGILVLTVLGGFFYIYKLKK